jgi:hypothetical protein
MKRRIVDKVMAAVVAAGLSYGCTSTLGGGAHARRMTLVVNPQCPPPACADVALGFQQQKTDAWCWAASGAMIMDPMLHVEQCGEANKVFGRHDCCKKQTPAKCIDGGFPPFGDYLFTFGRTHDTALPFDVIKQEITGGFPIAFSWHWLDDIDSGHMMVAVGYMDGDTDDTRKVHILDPESSSGDPTYITYNSYKKGGDHSHWDDFYHVER